MRVLAYDLFPDAALEATESFAYASLDEVLASAEILTLHCPPCADGQPLLDAAAIARMPAGSYLINTARADLLDESAVLAALESGHLAGLALDVFPQEPPADYPIIRVTPAWSPRRISAAAEGKRLPRGQRRGGESPGRAETVTYSDIRAI